MKRTTDLQTIRKNPGSFSWGHVLLITTIGPYTIVQFHPWSVDRATVHTGTPDTDRTEFFGYIDDKSTSESWDTLDQALAGLIAKRHTGSSRAGMFFTRMIRED